MPNTIISSIKRFAGAVSNGGVFAILSLIGSALSYLLYPFIARLLTPAQFGDASVVIALAGQIGGILLAFNVVSIYVVNTHTKADAIRISEAIQKVLIQLVFGITLITMLFSPLLLQVLQIDSLWTILGLGAVILLSVPAILWTGFLQGHNELARIGIYNLVIAAAKLVFAVALCAIGFGALGAIVGIIIGQLLGLWILRYLPGTELPSAQGSVSPVASQEWATIRPLLGYIGQSVLVVGAFSILFAIDILIAKAVFSPHYAGLYSGIASLGRIIFFLISILTWIMLAAITPQDQTKSTQALVRFLGMAVGGSLIIIAGFWLFAVPIINISLGSTYTWLQGQLWLTGLNQLVVSVLYAYTLYLLVLRRGNPALLAILVTVCTAVLGFRHVNDAQQLLEHLLIGQLVGYLIYALLVSGQKLWKRV